jgi:NDP-sugar pyrophosphorylase family protein
MKELVFAKELLPLFDGRPVIQHSIDALRRVTPHVVAVVNPKKRDLITYLQSQDIAVILDPDPQGLPDGIVKGVKPCRHILFALPDTYYQPEDAFIQLVEHPQDNIIGLFQSTTPETFDSVKTTVPSSAQTLTRSNAQLITRYAVKLDPPLSSWTMGSGKLSYQAARLLTPPKNFKTEYLLGDALNRLVKQKNLYGIKFKNSQYHDLGTPRSYMEYIVKRHLEPQ